MIWKGLVNYFSMISHMGGLVIWKGLFNSFLMIETNLALNIGNVRRLKIGEDPSIGCAQCHLPPELTMEALRERGIFYLSQLAILI